MTCLTAKQAALLRDVAEAIVCSGYATYPDRVKPRNVSAMTRHEVYMWLLDDVRLCSKARHTSAALIEETMQRYSVTRSNAKILIYRTRKMTGTNPRR